MKNMNFGLAIEAMRKGEKVARAGWNGKGMWLIYIQGSYASTGPCDSYGDYQVNDDKVNFDTERLPWIGMKTADNKFVPWLASQTDMLAEDWQIVM